MDLQETVKEVITLGNVQKTIWNDRFSYVSKATVDLFLLYPSHSSFFRSTNSRDVYTLCVAFPDPLADRLYAETKRFLQNHVKSLLDVQVAPQDTENPNSMINDTTLLQRYYAAWIEYSQGIQYLNYLYQYLNNTHVKRNKYTTEMEFSYSTTSDTNQEMMEIGELGLDIWRRSMIETLGAELVKQILEVIQVDRAGGDLGANSPQIVHGIIQSFVQVQDYKKKGQLLLYEELFEAPMLVASGEHFKAEAAKLLQHCSVSEYLEEVIKRLDEEDRRACKFFHGR